jgi:hypothetical protein
VEVLKKIVYCLSNFLKNNPAGFKLFVDLKGFPLLSSLLKETSSEQVMKKIVFLLYNLTFSELMDVSLLTSEICLAGIPQILMQRTDFDLEAYEIFGRLLDGLDENQIKSFIPSYLKLIENEMDLDVNLISSLNFKINNR